MDDLAAFGIDIAEGREVERDAAVARHLLDGVEVFPYVSKVKHRVIRIAESRTSEKRGRTKRGPSAHVVRSG